MTTISCASTEIAMRSDSTPSLGQALRDTAVLWVLLGIAAGLQLARAWGLELPLLARTTVWRLAQPGWAVAAVTAAVVAVTVLLVTSPRPERGYFVSGFLAALALVFFLAFDPGTGAAFAVTAASLHRRLGRQRRASSA